MESFCYTLLGFGLGFVSSQIFEKRQKINKQNNKQKQQNKGAAKYLPSTPDLKRAYQQQKKSISIQQSSPQEVGDRIRKIVKIQSQPLSQFAQDDELKFINEQSEDQNINGQIDNQATPNFQNKSLQPKNIYIQTNLEGIDENYELCQQLKSNQFSNCKQNNETPTPSISLTESSEEGE